MKKLQDLIEQIEEKDGVSFKEMFESLLYEKALAEVNIIREDLTILEAKGDDEDEDDDEDTETDDDDEDNEDDADSEDDEDLKEDKDDEDSDKDDDEDSENEDEEDDNEDDEDTVKEAVRRKSAPKYDPNRSFADREMKRNAEMKKAKAADKKARKSQKHKEMMAKYINTDH